MSSQPHQLLLGYFLILSFVDTIHLNKLSVLIYYLKAHKSTNYGIMK